MGKRENLTRRTVENTVTPSKIVDRPWRKGKLGEKGGD